MKTEQGARPRLSYASVRRLILLAGFLLLLLLALVMLVRGVDQVEVAGICLFIVVFVGFATRDLVGGVVGALIASLAYIALRYPQFDVVGGQRLMGLIFARVAGYFAFGVIGGLSNKQMRASLGKLDLYDQIDDATGLYNARFFLQDLDLEMSRAERYKTIFSVAAVHVPGDLVRPLSRKQRQGVLKEFGKMLAESVRNVDRASHGQSPTGHTFAVILPETGREGAEVFSNRLAERLAQYLGGRGMSVDVGKVQPGAFTLPEDKGKIAMFRDEFRSIVLAEHAPARESESREGERV